MGRVFSWNEIEEGKIPKLADFPVIVKKIRQDFEAEKGIIGGIFCGSIIGNNYNQRSDIDCVVMYDPAKRYEAVRVLQNINQIAAKLYVPVEFIPLDLHIVRTPLHFIDLPFFDHLRYAVKNNGLIKENLIPFFNFDGASEIEDVRGYLRNKLRRLEKGVSALSTMEIVELHLFLQKMLEAPMRVAWKMLWLQGMEMADDSRQVILRHYPDIASTQERELFAKINAADTRYSIELLLQLQCLDKARYSRIIENIKSLALDALEFVRFNALRLV